MSKKNIITFIACLFLLISIVNVSALSEDFSASSGEIVYVGECSTAVNKIIVKNTGAITSSYTVSVEGNAAKWTSYVPTSFVLKPAQTKEIFVYIKAPCGAKGNYNLNTYIKTKLGLEKLLKQEISIHETQNIKIEPVVYSASINPCETAVFEFDITNTEDFPETYEFKAEPFSDNTVFNVNNATIGAGKTSRIKMHVTPSCDVWGNYSLTLATRAKLSSSAAETSGIELEINRNYDFSLLFGDLYVPDGNETPAIVHHEGDYSLCEFEYGSIPVLIENNAGVENTYYIELEGGRKWTYLGGDVTTLAPGESAYVDINIMPPKPVNDAFNITLNVETGFGGIQKSETRNVIVNICHIPLIAEGVGKIKTYYNESYENLTILNTGSMITNYQLGISGADWISLIPSSLELLPGEEGSFYVHIQPTNETPEGRHTVTLKAGVDCSQSGCSQEHLKEIDVLLKEPRLSNMIFDEYLPFTILLIALLVIIAVSTVVFAVHLENTKDERAKANERRKKAREKRRLEKEKARERRRLEKEKLMLARDREKEKIRLARLKEREKRAIEKEKRKSRKIEDKRKTQKIKVEKEVKIKPEKPKKEINLGWLKWLLLVLFITIVLAIAVYAIYKSAGNILAYKSYLIIGVIALAGLVILFIVIEAFISRWYKEKIWGRLVPGQKGVILIRWKKGLGELVIRFKRPVENPKISIKRSSKQPTFTAAGEKVYQYFGIKKTNFENRDIEKVSFRFKIRKRWLRKHSIPENSVKLVKYNNEQWTGVRTEIMNADRKYLYYEANSQSFSLFAIIGKPKIIEAKPKVVEIKKPEIKKAEKKVIEKKPKLKKPRKEKSNTLKWLGIIVLGLIVVCAAGIGAFYTAKHIISLVNVTETNLTYTNITDIDIIPDIMDNVTDNATNATIDTNITPDITDANITHDAIENITVNITDTNITPDIIDNVTDNATDDSNATGPSEDDTQEGGIPNQKWGENTQHTLKLSDYFMDPDNDKLTYTYTSLEHITIEIDDNGIATFTPEQDWQGEERVVFTADDGKGGVVSSNSVKLVVGGADELLFVGKLKQGFSKYSNYVLIGVLILVILILLIEFRKPIMKFLEED